MSTILGQKLFLVAVNPDGSNFTDYSALTLPSAIDPTETPFEAVEVVADGPILAFTLFGMVSPNPTTTAQAGIAVRASARALTIAPDETAAMLLPAVSPFTPRVASGLFGLWRWQIARPVFWGVDSLTPANTQMGSGTFFDLVTAQAVKAGGGPPGFWGRYIGPKAGAGALMQPEASFLHSKNCKVLLIYGDTYAYTSGKNVIMVSTYADGVFHARKAINDITARGLTVPKDKSVWIYLDTEIGTNPNTGKPFPVLPPDFYRGWLDTMLGSVYGGAGGVYGNTDPGQDPNFTLPYCQAYTAGISFTQTDTQTGVCPLRQYFGNSVGKGTVTPGNKAAAGGTPGTSKLTEAMLAGEPEVIYVLWEITPGPNAVWSAGNWTVRLNVTLPSHFITWNGVEIVHVDQNCNGIERLGNLDGQSVSLIPPGVKIMVVPGIAPASAPAPGDKVLLLLSFSNSFKQHERSFGYTPDQLIDSPFARVGALVYTNQPDPGNSKGCGDFTFRQFSPTLPDKCTAPTVVYQYTIECPVTGAGTSQRVDYDLTNATGFASMW